MKPCKITLSRYKIKVISAPAKESQGYIQSFAFPPGSYWASAMKRINVTIPITKEARKTIMR